VLRGVVTGERRREPKVQSNRAPSQGARLLGRGLGAVMPVTCKGAPRACRKVFSGSSPHTIPRQDSPTRRLSPAPTLFSRAPAKSASNGSSATIFARRYSINVQMSPFTLPSPFPVPPSFKRAPAKSASNGSSATIFARRYSIEPYCRRDRSLSIARCSLPSASSVLCRAWGKEWGARKGEDSGKRRA
jgi:hypothetical protein